MSILVLHLMLSGTTLTRHITMGIDTAPQAASVLVLSCLAGVDVAITRTPFATPLILTTLSGHPEVSSLPAGPQPCYEGL
jgi:hypothetical protein